MRCAICLPTLALLSVYRPFRFSAVRYSVVNLRCYQDDHATLQSALEMLLSAGDGSGYSVLLLCFAVSGTGVGSAATSLCFCYALSGMETMLPSRSAMSGTALGCAAISLRDVRY
eukprot:72671-Rhodomonas_salina.4